MNQTAFAFQNCLVPICVTCGIACVATVLIHSMRPALADLFRRWLALGHLGRCVTLFMTTFLYVYGSTKPPSSTNEPPAGIEGDAPASTNEPPAGIGGDPAPTNNPPPLLTMGRPRMSAPPQLTGDSPVPASSTCLARWNARGAWNDWERMPFPEGFAFPLGTNMIDGVTLMSQGALRVTLADPTPVVSLPSPVSLEPGVSSCAYGLTASNSFLVAWSDVCVERDPTNRVDASIELFDSGDMTVRFGDAVTNIVARPPEGFVGEAQDETWLASAFPGDFTAITNGGYGAWLTDHVGHNEPNGLYKLSVTIAALPEHGPCYLVCGPYRMVVKAPGTYSFPLTDMTEYELYTCPTAVPLTWETDDGWDPPEPVYSPYLMSPAPRMMMGAPRNDDNRYRIERFPEVFVRPNYLTREQALNEVIELSCNAAGIAAHDYRSFSGQAIVRYLNHSEAVLEESLVQDEVYFSFEYNGRETCGTLSISPDYCWWWWHDPDSTNGTSNASSTNGTGSATNP